MEDERTSYVRCIRNGVCTLLSLIQLLYWHRNVAILLPTVWRVEIGKSAHGYEICQFVSEVFHKIVLFVGALRVLLMKDAIAFATEQYITCTRM